MSSPDRARDAIDRVAATVCSAGRIVEHPVVGVDPDPANKDLITSWARNYFDALHPYSSGGAYVNFMMEEGDDRIRATYRDNYARLAAIKAKYDPRNFFRVNQNIQPAR